MMEGQLTPTGCLLASIQYHSTRMPIYLHTQLHTHSHTQTNKKNFRFPREVILALCGGWNGEAQVIRKIIGDKKNPDNRYHTGPAQ